MKHFDTDRMEAFSDGVFAIAITLLVLELSIPVSGYEHLGRAILDEWPSYLAYVTSFLTIGVVWLIHHGIFRRMRFADHVVMRLNLLVLMVTSFLPFPTTLLAGGVDSVRAERTAVLFYGAVLVVLLSVLVAMCRHVARKPELLQEPASAAELEAIAKRIAPGLAFYAVILGAAALAPRVAAFGFLVFAMLALWRIEGDAA